MVEDLDVRHRPLKAEIPLIFMASCKCLLVAKLDSTELTKYLDNFLIKYILRTQ